MALQNAHDAESLKKLSATMVKERMMISQETDRKEDAKLLFAEEIRCSCNKSLNKKLIF